MSNKTQLAANNTQLASLIQTLQGKATGGGNSSEGSSGSSMGTCTVRIEPYQWMGDERIKYVIATTVVNGVITPYYQIFNNDNTSLGEGTDEVVTISNVLCGSIIGLGVYLYSDYPYYTEVGGGVSYLSYDRMYTSSMNHSDEIDLAIYQAPTDNGANGTIGFSVEP